MLLLRKSNVFYASKQIANIAILEIWQFGDFGVVGREI